MKKALIVLTNTEKYASIARSTGLWLSELTHVYDVFVTHGIAVDFVSPKGGYVPIDPASLANLDAISWKWYQDETFRNHALGNSLKPADIRAEEYAVIYYAGGHGTMYDFPKASEIAAIAETIYKNKGIVSAVCHGVAGLLNIKDETGEYLVKEKTITGFTNEEETIGKAVDIVPFLTEDALKQRGADFRAGAAYQDVVRIDGRLLTGQNPQSAHSLGEAIVTALK